jgi:hypothetical protein
MMGMTGGHNGTGFDNIEYMVCRPENDFFPDLAKVREEGAGGSSWAARGLAVHRLTGNPAQQGQHDNETGPLLRSLGAQG